MKRNNCFPVPVCLFVLAVSILLSGCFSIRPATSKLPQSMCETFYTESGTLYFIKPFEFKGKNESLSVDFTFRNKLSDADSAIINFSIIGLISVNTIDTVFFKNSNIEVHSCNTKLLFNEKNGKQDVSRFSTKISETELKNLFSKTDWKIEILTSGRKQVFFPQKSVQKKITKLGKLIFSDSPA